MQYRSHQSAIERYSTFTIKIEDLIREIVVQNNMPYYRIESMVEHDAHTSADSYIPVIRIITYFEDTVAKISHILEGELNVDQELSIDKKNIRVETFSYKHINYSASLKANRRELTEYKRLGDKKFEIQISSMLQDAWSGIEKELGYDDTAVPDAAKRDFYRVGALLEMADLEFLKIRKEHAKKHSVHIEQEGHEVNTFAEHLQAVAKETPAVPQSAPVVEAPVYVAPAAPVVEAPVYVAPQPEPVVEAPVYVAPQPAPVVEAPVYVAPQPAPVVEAPVYVAPQPEPVFEVPVYVAPQPEPVVEAPVYVAPAAPVYEIPAMPEAPAVAAQIFEQEPVAETPFIIAQPAQSAPVAETPAPAHHSFTETFSSFAAPVVKAAEHVKETLHNIAAAHPGVAHAAEAATSMIGANIGIDHLKSLAESINAKKETPAVVEEATPVVAQPQAIVPPVVAEYVAPAVAELPQIPVAEAIGSMNVNGNGMMEDVVHAIQPEQGTDKTVPFYDAATKPTKNIPVDENAPITDISLREYVINSKLLKEVDQQIAVRAGAKINPEIDIEGDVERLRFLKVYTLKQLHERITDNKDDIVAFAEKWIGKDNGGSFDSGICLFYLEYLMVGKRNDPAFAVEYVVKFISDNDYSARYIIPTYNSIRNNEAPNFSHLTLKA